MDKYINAEALKKEIAKAPAWTSLTIIEIINKMTEPKDEQQTCEECTYVWWNSEAKRYECSIEKCPYNKSKDEPITQTKTQNSNLTLETLEYCDICDHKGCEECIANALDEHCIPSQFKKQIEDECAKEYEELGLKELKELIEADRKTEPTISKMEQVDKDINVRSKDCTTCRHAGEVYEDPCELCYRHSYYEPKDESLTEGVWNAGYKTGYDKGYKDAQKVKNSQDLVKDLVKAFCEDGTWLERQGVYTLTLAEAKQRAVDIIESVLPKDEPQTEECPFDDPIPCEWVCSNSTDCAWKKGE